MQVVSRQRRWQLKQAAMGRCHTCGGRKKKSDKGVRCGACSEAFNRRRMKRRHAAKRRAKRAGGACKPQ